MKYLKPSLLVLLIVFLMGCAYHPRLGMTYDDWIANQSASWEYCDMTPKLVGATGSKEVWTLTRAGTYHGAFYYFEYGQLIKIDQVQLMQQKTLNYLYGTVDVTKTGNGFYEPTNSNDVRILKTIPDRKYVELGTVVVSIEPEDTAKMHNAIKFESAVLGADAVILTEEGFVGGGTKDSLLLKYWATGVVVKFE